MVMDNIFCRLSNEFFIHDFHNIFVNFISIICVFGNDKEKNKRYEFH